MTNTQIPDQEKTEFPGLEQLSQKIFQIPYADLTPNLKRCIRSKAAEAAAGDMLAALKQLTSILRDMHNVYESKAVEWLMQKPTFAQALAAIAKAEGR